MGNVARRMLCINECQGITVSMMRSVGKRCCEADILLPISRQVGYLPKLRFMQIGQTRNWHSVCSVSVKRVDTNPKLEGGYCGQASLFRVQEVFPKTNLAYFSQASHLTKWFPEKI
jgi:hypothetical protein